eukprot:CAMPEP_0183719360 /NCGR_PEP_ID=MMETSP0737-20130205/12336_1 /TAXON_ID=385413 /ORGANISM="Thalassiosira miniscula, Strain CCMP1093" /LENGTH=701 /DNA_ID=CAMNT_0025949077 /DNA_START=197 /DNA_END=2302 /DNA_ORIENTATION=+
MANHDPFPMRSEEARRLAASVENEEDEGWNKMGTSVASSLPKKGSNVSAGSAKDSLVSRKKKKGGKTKGAEGESIYDKDEMDEVHGVEDNDDDEEGGEGGGGGGGDDFIDAPLRDTRPMLRAEDVRDLPFPLGPIVLSLQGCYYAFRGCCKSIHRSVYGDTFPWDDFVRTMTLSSTLFVMIGGYWLLRSLKDAVLAALCGVESIPKAKMLSVFVVLGVVAVYNHLLDEKSGFRKEQLFYVFGTFYGVLFAGIAYLLNHPTIGLQNQVEDPSRILGWVSYCGIESFGSVMVSLFWSFANSNFNLKQAKRSYGVMVATAQLGSILGPTFVNQFGHSLGIPTCYMVGAGCMLMLQLTMWVYVKMFGVAEESPKVEEKKEDPKKKNKAGILEGIHLFMEHNYVKGIFAISCLFMVEVTIVDYTMKVLAKDHFSEEYPCLPHDEITGEAMNCWNVETNSPSGMSAEATKNFTTFMGLFGQATNTLSFFLSFFGTSAIIRKLGLRLTLLLFPSICLIVIITVRMYPTLNVVFAAMMILKANSYALNNPTKEMLYQPTSSSVKYKAKSWIDIFGARGSKAMGSVVTNAFSSSASELIDKGSLVGMCVASFLIWNARFMGKKFEEYTETGYIVGESNDDDDADGGYSEVSEGKSKNVEMASQQNDEQDTSCAYYEDNELGAEEEGQSEPDEDDIVGVTSPTKKQVVELV